MMKRNPLLKNADELLALGEAVAAVLAENQKQWDIPTEVEAVLRGASCGSGVCTRRLCRCSLPAVEPASPSIRCTAPAPHERQRARSGCRHVHQDGIRPQ